MHGIISNRFVMRILALVVVFFVSCSPVHENLVVYFEDGLTDDGPFGFPNFLEIENREPDLIRQFDDVKIQRSLFSQIEKAIENASPKISKFSIDSHKINPIYLVFLDSTKNCFFNSSNDFYNTHGEHLFRDDNLATTIKNLINYEDALKNRVDSDLPPPLYYKVILHLEK